ncbi:MAG: ATP-dependent protease ATPase subunit HslU [Myxococcales bacterium]|nr:ATP-dependent protease ATPase subunit HslU [Myxococcales bacterium]MCB9531073.1 ATP-dependent protease ATPase subunit HslU [Myxococcales bacterium]MCB9532983.1 ATP-dependent protease ATPase subunit HslU [Myxococcales bacterium]
MVQSLTPREVVNELDRYIVGQGAAKRAVALALRARWRRQQLPPELRDDVSPKNIIMIGPTGVGKTEIARRLARLSQAPFLKVEASKFTEVGYVGRDVESMVRDLVETGIALVRAEHEERVRSRAVAAAVERVAEALLKADGRSLVGADRESYIRRVRAGELDERSVEVQVPEKRPAMFEIFSPRGGMEEMGVSLGDMLGNAMPKRKRTAHLKVSQALRAYEAEEAEKLIDHEAIVAEALDRTQQHGIIFLDEIDKIAGREGARGPDVSREGVQRDLLPVVEGCNVNTKHGMVKTDHILFIAAGAFHVSKPSDLIPELQGRFPIRVELEALKEEDFTRILSEPRNSLVKQYVEMLATEGVTVRVDESAVAEIARIAGEVNRSLENIGARRLHTVMERVFEELSYHAPEMHGAVVDVGRDYVRERLADVVANEDLSRYIL